MSKHDHKHNVKPAIPVPEVSTTEKDKDDVDSEKWNPTPKQFKAFLSRDEQLAVDNIIMVMRARRVPISIKEIKDSTLHSVDVIERVLASGVETDSIVEARGKYSLALA